MTRLVAISSIFLALIAAIYPNAASGVDESDPHVCLHGWLSIVASVKRIDPPESTPEILGTDGKSRRKAVVGGCLSGGEILMLSPGVNSVDLFQKGDIVTVTRRTASYQVPHGLQAASKGASAYIDGFLNLARAARPVPARPTATGVRGDPSEDPNSSDRVRQPARPIGSLRGLPKQRLTADARVVIGWRNGKEPWSCMSVSPTGATLFESPPVLVAWCDVSLGTDAPARLLVRDAAGTEVDWYLSIVPWDEVPRPAWINGPEKTISSADRTAWAIWIWRSAGPEWRLQALSMLNKAAKESWLAGNFLNSVLAEIPLAPPAEAALR